MPHKKKVKLFMMVKDEVDIIEDWLKYHGSIFGFSNLYIIDNYSKDGTYEILQKYQEGRRGIYLIRKKDYKLKGDYMYHLMKDVAKNYDIAYPLDADEFIVFYDKVGNRIRTDNIRNYLDGLSTDHDNYKANYIMSTIDTADHIGYERATVQANFGLYTDYGRMAKTFFNNHKWKTRSLDHGNHHPNSDYLLTDICLLHYHCRNLEQMKKKVYNNVEGLGFSTTDLEKLEALPRDSVGNHHIRSLIAILKGTFSINTNFVGWGKDAST